MKRILFLLTLVLSCQMVVGQRQSYTGYMTAGDKAMQNQDFYSAYQYYEIAREYPDKENDPLALFKVGEAAYKARAYRSSTEALLTLSTLPEAADYPLLHYYLAENYFTTGSYDLAALNYQTFLDEEPDADADLLARAERNIEDANWAIDELMDERDVDIKHLGTPVNSEFSDFGYVQRDNGDVYFSSIRYKFKQDTMNPARRLSKILLQPGGSGEPRPLKNPMNWEDRMSSHTAFNGSGNVVFFSICDYGVTGDEVSCELYRADVNTDGSFSNPGPVTELNEAGSSSRMPSVGRFADGREFIFFVSDRTGGQGGLDLYMAPLDSDGTPGDVTPLTINTPGNEASPFFYNERQTLFFATDGRFTFGGLDVYKSYFDEGAFTPPVNLGSPINSSYDDAYYSQFANSDRAYLSSTRQVPDAIFFSEDKEVCCYDIYSLVPDNRIDLLARTFNKLSNEALLGATVVLCEITPDGPVVIAEVTNSDGNDFTFKLEPGRIYELKATKDGFTKAIDRFDLNDPELVNRGLIRRDLYLSPGVMLDVFTFNGNDNSPLAAATVTLYELDENNERSPVATLTNNNSNDFAFELEPGKRYLVEGEREGFGVASKEIDLTNYVPDGERLREDLYLGQLLEILVVDGTTDEPLTGATVELKKSGGDRVGIKTNEIGNDFYFTVNLNEAFVVNTSREEYQSRTDTLLIDPDELSEKAGTLRYVIPLYPSDINRLLPLSVFFDNDHPNPRSYSPTTNLGYDETYQPYYDRREEFIEEFTAGLGQEDAFVLSVRFEDFFNLQVKGGYEKLNAFTKALEAYLQNGSSFNMSMSSYTSPLAKESYNQILSRRRNASLRNYFIRYDEGALMPYIDAGKLTFTTVNYGENRPTAEAISDRLDDPRESVFSIIASLQRRVELNNADRRAGRNK